MSRLLRRLFARKLPTPATRRSVRRAFDLRARLLLQGLESRIAPATFNVTNTNDSGAGSFRQAILDANAASGVDTIAFSTLFNSAQTISLTTTPDSSNPSALNITDSVTINGPGANLLTVRRDAAAPNMRVFTVNGPGVITVSISGMTISGGNTDGVVSGNSGNGTTGDGAALRMFDDNVVLDRVVITGNTSGSEGGGIGVAAASNNGGGSLTIRNSTISGNTSTGTPPVGSSGGGGGGIYFAAGGSLLLENSTVSGNVATHSTAGGIYLYGVAVSPVGFTIRNSTITGNSAAGSPVTVNTGGAGGLYIGNVTGNVVIQNSTIANNTFNGTGAGGIGIFRATGTTVSIESTVVANNSGTGSPDVLGTVKANFGLIRDQTGTVLAAGSGNNLAANTNPMLGALGNNGGPTQTMALLTGSPLINAGSNPANVGTDQRGVGFPRQVGQADIGAFEVVPPGTPSASGTFSNVTTAGGTTYTFQVTFIDDVAVNVSTLGTGDVRVTGPNAFNFVPTFVSVDTNTNGTPRTATYSFTPPGGAWSFAGNGVYTIAVEPSQVTDTSGNFVPAAPVGTFQVALPGTFTVTNAADSGPGSLRQAILDANTNAPSADAIVFGPLFNSAQTITLASSLPDVSDALTITGPGANLLTVRRDPANAALFRIISFAASTTLSGMTLSGGQTTGTIRPDRGGGAISIRSTAPMTIQDSVITGNTASGEGGGIYVRAGGNLTIRNSTISGNTAGTNASGIRTGGGIYFASGGSLLMENCTVSGNSSPTGGGGLYIYGYNTVMNATIRNSTISGNTAAANATAPVGGGGIEFLVSNTTTLAHSLTLQNCTVVGNSSTGTAAGTGGGGIARLGNGTGTVTLTSTVVANNTSGSGTGNDILAPSSANFTAVTANNSLVRDQNGAAFNGSNNLAAGINPMLGALGNNGGPTQTMAIQAGSPLINAGSNPASLTTDQRGPGFARVVGGAADIGAFEVQAAGQASVSTVGVNAGQSNTVQRSMVTNVTVTFDRVVSFVGQPTNAFKLTRVGPGTPNGDVTLAVDLTGSTASQTIAKLTFSGALTEGVASNLSLIDGNYTLTVLSNQITGGLTSDNVSNLFRLFGDIDGNKTVNGIDLTAFRNAFGTNSTDANYLPFLDFDGNGAINGSDLTQFRNRFGVILP
jgi:parallel beta-helix repeat protein